MILNLVRNCFFLLILALMPLMGFSEIDRSPYALGSFHREISTSSKEAQVWFNRGLALSYGFNHEEAIRCFQAAAEADPNCAMAWWGIAYASGPNINNVDMSPAAVERAQSNVAKALALVSQASPVEAALIRALSRRYAVPAPPDRSQLNQNYAQAMRRVARDFDDDADVVAIFAEALMVLRPWYHWTPEGNMMPETPEIISVLEGGLKRWPNHPALCHFYIHTMEASPNPEKALPAANRLRELLPGSGHLVHMPSHIDVLVGDYQAAIIANQKGIAADLEYVKKRGAVNFYTLYRIHNYHFIVYAAMFDGQSKLAEETARELERQIPKELLASIPDFVEAFLPTRLHVLVRFGRWDDILQEPAPAKDLYVSKTVWHYARSLAFAATNRVKEAELEKEKFDGAYAAIPESRYLFQNSARSILKVADAMIDGEIAYRKGHIEKGFAHLRRAVTLDDSLNYDEPWGWMQPARHALGALLLEQGQVEEAERVYRADLKRHPKNAWALHGLAECLERNKKDATKVRDELDKACRRTDVDIKASCYCRLSAQED